MKWWYVKRFLTIHTVLDYEYVILLDEDAGLESFDIGITYYILHYIYIHIYIYIYIYLFIYIHILFF